MIEPAWTPDKHSIETTNIWRFMHGLNIHSVAELHAWSIHHADAFWQQVIHQLNISFKTPPSKICDLSRGIENPCWLPEAKLNITDTCFNPSSTSTAIIFQDYHQPIQKMSYGELQCLTNRIANSLISHGFTAGDAIAIDMPMTANAVAIYLAIIRIGGIVVSIADSFSSAEIATRLRIAQVKSIFTQDYILRDDKKLPLYEKIIAALAPQTIVLPCETTLALPLRKNDIAWQDFLLTKDIFSPHYGHAMTHCNILFSSGTTAEPKAIPWNHTTPIKVASDAFFHQNIQAGDILAWPTNLGWMMGPWLIFAALINRGTIALYNDRPMGRDFGKFIQEAKVTMLGVVPTLVASWHQSRCMEGLDWNTIKLFSSSGECSNANDMRYLMSLAKHKPIIEYCGGTEIGGAYLSSTVIEKNYPTLFTTPAMGIDFVLLNEEGQETDNGEVALISPAFGLSTELLNADHHQVYFADMPCFKEITLRRHGDHICRLNNGCYQILGRVDDTMNLSGIKIGAAEIERVLKETENIIETAAIAISAQEQGPDKLIIYAVSSQKMDNDLLKKSMQKRIDQYLNPLFKIHEVILVDALPKTASNKIIRRALRKYS